MRYVVGIILLAIVLQGCTTINEYSEPKSAAAQVALLKGKSDRQGLATWSYFVVEAIDEQPISFFKTGTGFDFKLTPGKHKILMKAGFNRGWGDLCPCESRLVVTGSFSAGNTYRLNGKVVDNRIKAWVENADTGAIVSNTDEEAYVSTPL